MTHPQLKGWLQAFFTVLILWGISNIMLSFSTQIMGVNKIVFACSTYLSCSFFLLLFAGSGPLSRETLRSVDTWAYGIILLANYFVAMNLYATVTATEASLFQRISIFFSLMAGWFFLSRKPSKTQLGGVAAITLGVLAVLAGVPEEKAGKIFILIALTGILQALRIFIAELHRPHKQAAISKSTKTQCRVVGYVMFIITFLFMCIVSFLGFVESVAPIPGLNMSVSLQNFMHPASIFLGMVMGIFIYAPMRYFEFSTSHLIRAESFMAVTALSLISTLFWEWATQPLTGLNLREISTPDLLAGAIITLGGLAMAISQITRKKTKEEEWKEFLVFSGQNLEAVSDSREIIAKTLEHFNHNLKKSAQALELPATVVQSMLDDTEKTLALTPAAFLKTSRAYRQNVAGVDTLTGLPNRAAFLFKLKELIQQQSSFCVLYLDLNKFKPVNDTYGHKAGDEILIQVAERLTKNAPKNALVTRLGGDEYVLALPNTTEGDKIAELLKSSIAKPYKLKTVPDLVEIGASFGISQFPTDGKTPEILLERADKAMYSVKKSR